METAKLKQYENPFYVRSLLEDDNFLEKERMKSKKKQELMLKQQVHEKMTTTALIRFYPTTVRTLRKFAEKEMKKAWEFTKNTQPGYVEPEYILELTKDIHRLGEKSATEYIHRNKIILLSDHALKVKQQDMHRMKDLAETFEEKISKEEKRLEKDALNFNEFIKNTNTATAEAIEETVKETRLRLQKAEEMRNINAELFLLKSEIAKLERMLGEYLLCAAFLKAATPRGEEWEEKGYVPETKSTVESHEPKKLVADSGSDDLIQKDEDLSPIDVPFNDASELLKAINRFRDQNLSIISNSHYVSYTLKEAQETFQAVKEKLEKDLHLYETQIAELKKEIKTSEHQAKKLESLASISAQKSANEEKEFQENLAPHVALTYELCTGIKGGKISLTMMVTAIESFLLGLLSDVQKLPEKVLLKAYRLKQVERKIQKRKEDEERRAKAQQERMKKSDQRRFDSEKVKLGRRLQYRPPSKQILKKKEISAGVSEDEQEDYHYFFR